MVSLWVCGYDAGSVSRSEFGCSAFVGAGGRYIIDMPLGWQFGICSGRSYWVIRLPFLNKVSWPSGDRPPPKPMFTLICVAIGHHLATVG